MIDKITVLTEQNIEDATDAWVVAYIQGNTPLNRARREFSKARIAIELKQSNSKIRYSPVTMRRDELKACIAIANAANGVLK